MITRDSFLQSLESFSLALVGAARRFSVGAGATHLAARATADPVSTDVERYASLIAQLMGQQPAGQGYSVGLVGVGSVDVAPIADGLAASGIALRKGSALIVDAAVPSDRSETSSPSDPDVSWVDAILGEVPWRAAIQPTQFAGPFRLSSTHAPLPPQAYSVEHLRAGISNLKQQFKLIVVILPSPETHANSRFFAESLDSVLMVVEANSTSCEAARRTQRALQSTDTKGIILVQR